MLTYNAYYNRCEKEVREATHKDEEINGKWWDSNSIADDINDVPIIENKTHVQSSKFVILHHMCVSRLIDYVNSHPVDNEVMTFSLDLDLTTGDWRNYINNSGNVKVNIPDSDFDFQYNTFKLIDDKEIINSYDGLCEGIYHFISEFIRRNRANINTTLTKVFFRADGLRDSFIEGKWMPTTDSSLTFYHDDEIIVCSM